MPGMKRLLRFIAEHDGVRVRRIEGVSVWLTSPAVQSYGELCCDCSDLSDRLTGWTEVRAYLGY